MLILDGYTVQHLGGKPIASFDLESNTSGRHAVEDGRGNSAGVSMLLLLICRRRIMVTLTTVTMADNVSRPVVCYLVKANSSRPVSRK
jgi:hypothetical protein